MNNFNDSLTALMMVFRIDEASVETRCDLIKMIGHRIDDFYSFPLTKALVRELTDSLKKPKELPPEEL